MRLWSCGVFTASVITYIKSSQTQYVFFCLPLFMVVPCSFTWSFFFIVDMAKNVRDFFLTCLSVGHIGKLD